MYSFNGAAIFRPRKQSCLDAMRRNPNQLQWGRDLSTAETQGNPTGKIFRIYASMGPRSFDRGNRPLFAYQWRIVLASMGPRSFDRGNRLGG